jgi:hypothetical protein
MMIRSFERNAGTIKHKVGGIHSLKRRKNIELQGDGSMGTCIAVAFLAFMIAEYWVEIL